LQTLGTPRLQAVKNLSALFDDENDVIVVDEIMCVSCLAADSCFNTVVPSMAFILQKHKLIPAKRPLCLFDIFMTEMYFGNVLTDIITYRNLNDVGQMCIHDLTFIELFSHKTCMRAPSELHVCVKHFVNVLVQRFCVLDSSSTGDPSNWCISSSYKGVSLVCLLGGDECCGGYVTNGEW
jgi:hypothetical protein